MMALSACGGSTGSVVSFQELDASTPLRGAPADSFDPPATTPQDRNFAGLLNSFRNNQGERRVTYNARLNRAAQNHADDMVRRDYFSHDSPEGRNAGDRIRAQGYSPSTWGENIAARQQSDAQVLRDWRNSPSHRALLVSDRMQEFGLGVAGRGNDTKWVLVMATD